jgi:hypothetical protein
MKGKLAKVIVTGNLYESPTEPNDIGAELYTFVGDYIIVLGDNPDRKDEWLVYHQRLGKQYYMIHEHRLEVIE